MAKFMTVTVIMKYVYLRLNSLLKPLQNQATQISSTNHMNTDGTHKQMREKKTATTTELNIIKE